MAYSHFLLTLFFAISVPVHDFRSIEQETSTAGNETAITVEPTSPVSESVAQINESDQPSKEIDDKNSNRDVEKDGTTVDTSAQQPSDGDGEGKVGGERVKELIENGTTIIDESSMNTDGIKLEPRSLLTELQNDRLTPDNGNGAIPNTENNNVLLDEVDKNVQSDLPTLIHDSKNTTNEILATDASAVIDNKKSQEIQVRSLPITEQIDTVSENAEQLLANFTDLIVRSSTSTDGDIDEIGKDKFLQAVEKDETTVDTSDHQPSDGDGEGKVGGERGKELIENGTIIIDESSVNTDGIKLEPRSLLTGLQKDRLTPDNGNGAIPNTENNNLLGLLDEVDKNVQSDLPTLIHDSNNTTNEILATDTSAVIDNKKSQEIQVRSLHITEKTDTVSENAEQLLANFTDLIERSSTSTDGNIDEIGKDKSLQAVEKDGTTVDTSDQQPSDGNGEEKVGGERGKELIENGTTIIDESSVNTDGIKLEPRSLLTELQKDRSTPDNGNGAITNTENNNLLGLLDEVDKNVQSDLPTLIHDSKNTTNEILATDASAVIDNQKSQEIQVRSLPITEKNNTVIENEEQLLANFTDLIVKSSTSTDGNIDEIGKDKSLTNVEASGISVLSPTNKTIDKQGKNSSSTTLDASQKSEASNNQPSPEVGLHVKELPITEYKDLKIENRDQLPSNSTDLIEDSSTPTDGNIEDIEKDKSLMTIKSLMMLASAISGTNNNSNIQLSPDTQVGKLPITGKEESKFGKQQSSSSKDLIVESSTPPQTDEKIGNYNSSTDVVTSDIPELSNSTNFNATNEPLMNNNSSIILNGRNVNASFPQKCDIKDFREGTVTDPKYSLHIGDQDPREIFQNNSAETTASDISNKEVNNRVGNNVDGIHNSTKSHPSEKQAQQSYSATIWTPFDWKEYYATKLDQDNSDSINNNEANVEVITPGKINIENYSMNPIEDYQPNGNINTFNDRNSNLSPANAGIKLFLNLDEVSLQPKSFNPKSQKYKKVHLTEYSEYLFVPGNFIDNQSQQTKLSLSSKVKFERESRRRKNIYYPVENFETFTNKFGKSKSGIFHLKKQAQSNQKQNRISKPSDLNMNRVGNFQNSIKFIIVIIL